MPREKEVKEHKVKIVKKVTESLKKSKVVVLTSYSGMKTADLTALRRKLRTAGVEYHVIKNTLARFAARDAAKGFSQDAFNGPLAAAFGYEDPVMTAKLLVDYARNADISLSIVGGILGEQLLNPDEVKELAQLPSREVLLGRVIGGIQWPLTGLVSCLAGPIRGLAYILQARIKQLEEA